MRKFCSVFVMFIIAISPITIHAEEVHEDNKWYLIAEDYSVDVYFSNEVGERLSEDFNATFLNEKMNEYLQNEKLRWNASASTSNAFLVSGGYEVRVPIIRRSDNNQLLYCMQSSANFPVEDAYQGLGNPYHNDNILGIFYYGTNNDQKGSLAEKYGLSWTEGQYGTQVALWRKLHQNGYPSNGFLYQNLAGKQSLIHYIDELSNKQFSSRPQSFLINFDGKIEQKNPQKSSLITISEQLNFSVSTNNNKTWITDANGNKKSDFKKGEKFRVYGKPELIDKVKVTVKTEQVNLTSMVFGAKNPSTQSVGLLSIGDPIIFTKDVTLDFKGALGGFKLHKEDNLGNNLGNIVFALSNKKDVLDPVIDVDGKQVKVVTDKFGNAFYPEKILLGKYWLFETQYPNHLWPLQEPLEVNINPGATIELPMITNLIKKFKQFEVFKFEHIDNNKVGLVRTFNIYEKGTINLVDTIRTNEDGIARTIWLPANRINTQGQEIEQHYYAKEILGTNEEQAFQEIPLVELSGTEDTNHVIPIEIENKRKEIGFVFFKNDERGLPVQGSEFHAYDDNGVRYAKVSSDVNGKVQLPFYDITKINKGKGYVEEVSTNASMTLNQEQIFFPKVQYEEVVHQQVIAINQQQPFINKDTSIIIRKIAENKPQSGNTFVIKLLEKNFHGDYTYDLNEKKECKLDRNKTCLFNLFLKATPGDDVITFQTTDELNHVFKQIPIGFKIGIYEKKSLGGFELKHIKVPKGDGILDKKLAVITIDEKEKIIEFENGKITILVKTGDTTLEMVMVSSLLLLIALECFIIARNRKLSNMLEEDFSDECEGLLEEDSVCK